MTDNKIYNDEPASTQIFPDFYLSKDRQKGLLEIKAFNYQASPAFDIANFESYCDSVTKKSYRLDADYLVFGYEMNELGEIKIKKIWLKKIWELAGASTRYALNTQIKRDVIYNIRPSSNFKFDRQSVFSSKEQFLAAIYSTLEKYRGKTKADNWKELVITNYQQFMNTTLSF